jgi:hypothetical protein
LKPDQARAINQSRQTILRQNKRIASPDGADDPWDESGPDQPDPTNNQAYTKQIMTTPDHAVLDSLTKKEVHAPTASRRARELSRAARQKYRLAAGEEDEADRTGFIPSNPSSLSADVGDEDEVPDIAEDEEEELGDEEELLDESEELAEDSQDVMEDEMEDAEFGEEEALEDLEGDEEDALDLDEDGGDLDDMLDMEDAEFGDEEDLGEPDIFDDVDMDEDVAGMGGGGMGAPGGGSGTGMAMPMSSRQRRPASRQAGRGRRMVAGARQSQDRRLKTGAGGGQGPARMSLDEILDVHDDDIERTASTPLEGDDLEALLGARVDRAGRRVATTKRAERESPAVQQKRAMLENVWDTENEPEMVQARGSQVPTRRRVATAPQQQHRRQAAKRGRPVQQQFAPDRRRTPQRTADNEFDQVFGVDGMPDVSKFFD